MSWLRARRRARRRAAFLADLKARRRLYIQWDFWTLSAEPAGRWAVRHERQLRKNWLEDLGEDAVALPVFGWDGRVT